MAGHVSSWEGSKRNVSIFIHSNIFPYKRERERRTVSHRERFNGISPTQIFCNVSIMFFWRTSPNKISRRESYFVYMYVRADVCA